MINFYQQFQSIYQNNSQQMSKYQSEVIHQNSDQSNSDQELCNNGQLEVFNQQYSLIYQMSKKFFEYSKQAIMKYINYTRFGAKLNIGLVSKWIVNTQQSIHQNNNLKKLKNVQFAQKKQLQFQEILKNIRQNIEGMIQFQKNFKTEFMENYLNKSKSNISPNIKIEPIPPPIHNQTKTVNLDQSICSETSKQTQISVTSIQSDRRSKCSQKKQEVVDDQLRKSLRNVLRPIPNELQKIQPDKINIDLVKHKIKIIKDIIVNEKEREKKIFEVFQKKKTIIADIDLSSPAVIELNNQINQLKLNIQKLKLELKKKQSQIDRLGQKLIKQMLKQSEKNRQKIFENQNIIAFFLYKNEKLKPFKIKKVQSIDLKYLFSYIFTLQEKICDILLNYSKISRSHQQEIKSLTSSSSSINLNVSFNNVYSPIDIKNIINPSSFLKKK